MKTKILPP